MPNPVKRNEYHAELAPTIEIARPVFDDWSSREQNCAQGGPIQASDLGDTAASVDSTIEMEIAPVASKIVSVSTACIKPGACAD